MIEYNKSVSEEEAHLSKILKGTVEDAVWDMPHNRKADSGFYTRFLRDYNYNLEHAESAIRKTMKWRRDNKINEMLLTELEEDVIHESFPYYRGPHDRMKCPVALIPMGSWQFDSVTKNHTEHKLMRHIHRMMEVGQVTLDREQNPGEIQVPMVIVDWTGLPPALILSRHILPVIVQFLRDAKTHYPESYRVVYNINCSAGYKFIFNQVVKRILPKKYTNRFFVLGSKEEWMPLLERDMDKNEMFTIHGGTWPLVPVKE